MSDFQTIDTARKTLQNAIRDLDQARAELAAAIKDLNGKQRIYPGDHATVKDAKGTRDQTAMLVADCEKRVNAATDALKNARGAPASTEPQDYETLASPYPIVMLPIRIETRLDKGASGPILKIRIYPDEIYAETLETELTKSEIDLGAAFWHRARFPALQQEAWHAAVKAFDPSRAAYVIGAMTPAQFPHPVPNSLGPSLSYWDWIKFLIGLWQDSSPHTGAPGLTGGFMGGLAGPSGLPNKTPKPAAWTKPARASLLPDLWHVAVYLKEPAFPPDADDPKQVIRGFSTHPVNEPLILTFDPNKKYDPATLYSGTGLEWTIDYSAAGTAGMAIDVTLNGLPAGTTSIYRILVHGVKSSLPPEQVSNSLASLLSQHHYTKGIGYVAHGTPTSNTAESVSGYPTSDPDGDQFFKREFHPDPKLNDGETAFVNALGLPNDISTRMEDRDKVDVERDPTTRQDLVSKMNQAIWPATLGYYLEQFGPQGLSVDDIRKYFINSVSGHGRIPAFRIGNRPYGVLPVSSLGGWKHDPTNEFAIEGTLLDPLQKLFKSYWRPAAQNAPHIGRTGDTAQDLLESLGMDASSREARVRFALGPQFQMHLAQFSVALYLYGSAYKGIAWDKWQSNKAQALGALLKNLGVTAKPPMGAHLLFNDKALFIQHHLLTGEAIDPVTGKVSGDGPNPGILVPLLNGILNSKKLADFSSLSDGQSLFIRLLMHSILLDCVKGAYTLAGTDNHTDPQFKSFKEPELYNLTVSVEDDDIITPENDVTPIWDVLKTYGDKVLPDVINKYSGLIQSFIKPSGLDQLNRCFSESLDLCSHRLDAWITSLYANRLERMRTGSGRTLSYLGAYGWVENLSLGPSSREASLANEHGTSTPMLVDNQGFIHAPSMTHAATAAIMRNAFFARENKDSKDQPYSVNLSSKSVRTARWFLDSVRDGRLPGEILGYHLESTIHEDYVNDVQYLEAVRQKYPLSTPSSASAGGARPRGMIDGLAVWLALDEDHPQPAPFAIGTADFKNDVKKILGEIIHPTADLLTAESVYQTVRGNTMASAAALDTLASGTRPPDPEVGRQPRTGTTLTHRVALLLDLAAPSNWPQIPTTPRATFQPYLDQWIGQTLGDPTDASCVVYSKDAGAQDSPTDPSVPVGLPELLLRPVDWIMIASQQDELDLRVLELAKPKLAAKYPDVTDWSKKQLRISYDPLLPHLEHARSIAKVLGGARPLRPGDLMALDGQPTATEDDLSSPAGKLADGALGALNDLLKHLNDIRNSLNASPLTNHAYGPVADLLKKAAGFGVPSAYPSPVDLTKDDQAQNFRDKVDSVIAELTARSTRASNTTDSPKASDKMKAIFGRSYVFLPQFTLDDATKAELGLALNGGDALVADDAKTASQRKRKWFRDTSRVRANLAEWRKLSVYSASFRIDSLDFKLAQLPQGAAPKWIGLPSETPPNGCVSILINRPNPQNANGDTAGLLLDEWSEIIPSATEHTGVAFHYDSPLAQAPHAVLVAIPPVLNEKWSRQKVEAILNHAFDLAKIRAVDLEALPAQQDPTKFDDGGIGQFVPPILLAGNASKEPMTVSVRFKDWGLMNEATTT